MTAEPTCTCTCGKHYRCDEDPHEWKPTTTTDRDTLAALIGELRQYADDSDDVRYGTLSTLLVRQYLDKIETEVAGRDRRVAAQERNRLADEVRRVREHGLRPDETYGPSSEAFETWLRADSTEGTHHAND